VRDAVAGVVSNCKACAEREWGGALFFDFFLYWSRGEGYYREES